ncbi:hypothetical protein [Algibacillus agarilyticus]|uniref:hypothetical protein n=1 Tax=Algibacillus agarilyticus TaxID=2234133 RepID=UPI000DCFCAD8|nr:hypothetical protein [Algibacillus agarilyticus]
MNKKYTYAAMGIVVSILSTQAHADFKGWNPNWTNLTSNVDRAVTSAQQSAMVNNVKNGNIDTRGTQINVNNAAVETTGTGSRSVMPNSDMLWHNPFGTTYSTSPSTRWYQKDGNTQVFRIFPGDQNHYGNRVGAGRSEAFVGRHLSTVEADGKTMTFSARFRVEKNNGSKDVMLFQSKGSGLNTEDGTYPAWGISLWVEKDGDVILVKRNSVFSQNEKIDTGYNVGQGFNLRVVDDGYNYKAFINNVEKAAGTWERGNTPTVARWGIYVQGGESGVLNGTINDEQIVYVSGARATLN